MESTTVQYQRPNPVPCGGVATSFTKHHCAYEEVLHATHPTWIQKQQLGDPTMSSLACVSNALGVKHLIAQFGLTLACLG
jgi:hypothetical protein